MDWSKEGDGRSGWVKTRSLVGSNCVVVVGALMRSCNRRN